MCVVDGDNGVVTRWKVMLGGEFIEAPESYDEVYVEAEYGAPEFGDMVEVVEPDYKAIEADPEEVENGG